MTHGGLLVKDARWRVILHTHHDGQTIPTLPGKVFDLVAERNLRFFTATTTREDVLDLLYRLNEFERFEYATSAAALVVAAKPFLLEFTTPGSRRELPSWSGLDAPYRLDVGPRLWRLWNEDGRRAAVFDYRGEVVTRVLRLLTGSTGGGS